MRVFSKLFYLDELIPTICEQTSTESKLLRHLNDILPNPRERTPNHGVFFIGIRGENKQDYDSPSWYNAAEAKSVGFIWEWVISSQTSLIAFGFVVRHILFAILIASTHAEFCLFLESCSCWKRLKFMKSV